MLHIQLYTKKTRRTSNDIKNTTRPTERKKIDRRTKMTNTVYIEGRLTAKPQAGLTTNGKKYSRFSVCYNENYKTPNGEWASNPNFFNCTSWGKTAEYTESLDKGDPVFISGRLKSESYTNSKGEKKNITYIVSFRVQKLAIEKKSGTSTPAPQSQSFAPQETVIQNDDFSDFTPVFEDFEPPEFDIQ